MTENEYMYEVSGNDVMPAFDLITDPYAFQVDDPTDPDQLIGNVDIYYAGVDLLGRTGADEFFNRTEKTFLPVAWILTVRWGDRWETTSGHTAEQAMFRMLQEVVDGGMCLHCNLPTAVVRDFEDDLDRDHVCWYQFDPELKKFRRSCEGEE